MPLLVPSTQDKDLLALGYVLIGNLKRCMGKDRSRMLNSGSLPRLARAKTGKLPPPDLILNLHCLSTSFDNRRHHGSYRHYRQGIFRDATSAVCSPKKLPSYLTVGLPANNSIELSLLVTPTTMAGVQERGLMDFVAYIGQRSDNSCGYPHCQHTQS